ncbi:MAG: FAD:protein FMN transferase [Dehalococcoidia bacterium]
MRSVTFRAMDTDIDLAVAEPCDRSRVGLAFAAVEALFAHYDQALTRFSPESELSLLNRAEGQPRVVPPLLFEAISRALQAADASAGVFDPTVLDALLSAGYDRTFAIVSLITPSARPAVPVPFAGAYRRIRLDPDTRTVYLPNGIHLDLGGIAKGMAVDAAVAILQPVQNFFVNAGGDLSARGEDESGPWLVGVQNPFDPATDLATIAARDCSVATSSTVRRRWQRGGVERHHLIDPRTGSSAESGLVAATVVAADATSADVLAKVALILGRRSGRAFVEASGAACLLVTDDGAVEMSSGFPLV